MFVVDTNILVYAADEASAGHAACRAFLQRTRAAPSAWFLTWGIVYEFLRVVTHPRVMRRPWATEQAWQFMTALLASPGCGLLQETERHPLVLRQVLATQPELSGNLMHDTHTAALMMEHGIHRIQTADADFKRFPFLQVLNPCVD